MATETAIIDFDKTFLTIGPDSVAAFVDSGSAFADETSNELLYATAKRTVNDDGDELEDDDEEEDEDDDDDLEDDEEEDEDVDDDELEDDDDEDDDDDADEEEEDEDVDELQVSSRR